MSRFLSSHRDSSVKGLLWTGIAASQLRVSIPGFCVLPRKTNIPASSESLVVMAGRTEPGGNCPGSTPSHTEWLLDTTILPSVSWGPR